MTENKTPLALECIIKRLRETNLSTKRFMKLNENKMAFEKDWQLDPHDVQDLDSYPRWGIAGREGLVLIDADNEQMANEIRKRLPETFEVVSPRRGMPHFYYAVKDGQVENVILRVEGMAGGSGEVRAQNHYLVAPGTEIKYKDLKTGEEKIGTYEIVKDIPIATVDFKTFNQVLEPFKGKDESRFDFERIKNGVSAGERHGIGISYAVFLLGAKGFDPTTALYELESWNHKNIPPMEEKDLKRMVRNAIRYVKKAEATQYGDDELEPIERELEDVDVYEDFVEFFGKEIKEDPRIIEMIFPKLMSAYTTDPANLGIEAPTSEGKTYAVVKIAKYFPKGDVWLLGGLSPKALIHQRGQLIGENDEPLEPILNELRVEAEMAKQSKDSAKIEEIKQRRREIMAKSRYLIELENKIIIMLESPSLETWEMLRPVLSHDSSETTYKFVDKQSMMTYTVVIRGWPVFIYCKAGRGKEDIIWDQIQSRFTTISPKMDAKKYRAAVELTAMKKGLPTSVFKKNLGLENEDDIRRFIGGIRKRLLGITSNARKVNKDYDTNIFWIPFYKKIGCDFPASIGRHMRDSSRFFQDMQLSAAVNVFSRPILKLNGGENIVVVKQDYDRAIEHYFGEGGDEVLTGLPGNIIGFFKDVIVPLWKKRTTESGVTVREMVDATRDARHKIKSASTLNKHYLPALEEAGLMTSDPDAEDKRRMRWTVLTEEITEHEIGAISSRNEKCSIFSPEAFKEACAEVNAMSAELCYKQTKNSEGSDLMRFYNTFFVCLSPKEAPIPVEAQKGANGESSDKIEYISPTEQKAPIITVEPEQLKEPTSIRTRLVEAFGTIPFKISQLKEHFQGPDLEAAYTMLPEMAQRGEAERWPFESEGIEGWQLIKKETGK